jgi:hypothetical protein
VLERPILDAHLSVVADLVLCSHVPAADWMTHLEHLGSWLAPSGVLVAVVQNDDTECMRMLEHICGHRFHLGELASRCETRRGREYQVEMATVPAQMAMADCASAYIVAEFMLNLLPLS